MLAVVFILSMTYILLRRDRVGNFVYPKSIDLFKSAAMSRLPDGYTREQTEALFSRVLQKLKRGDFDKEKLQAFKANMIKSLNDNKLDSLEINLLLQNLQDLNHSNTQVK